MNNIIFVLCIVFAAVKGQVRDVANYNISAERGDEYIRLNREALFGAVADVDNILAEFRDTFTTSVASVGMQAPMTIARIEEMEKRLSPLEVMDNFSSTCVNKYRHLMPTVIGIKSTLDSCTLSATNQLPNLLRDPQNHRNVMNSYITTYFITECDKCGKTFPKTAGNYTNCITVVVRNTNANMVVYKRGFSILMDMARCTATSHIKVLATCFTDTQDLVSSQLAETIISVNYCMAGRDQECKPCAAVCADVRDMKVDYKNATIENPFLGAKENKGCLLLNLK